MNIGSGNLAKNLKQRLSEHRLTTAELARRCGVPQPVLHRLVVGSITNPQINTLLPIAQYFNCTIDSLLNGSPNQEAENHGQKATLSHSRHQIQNEFASLQTFFAGLENVLPVLVTTYFKLPSELRSGELSTSVLELLPSLLKQNYLLLNRLRQVLTQLTME